MSINTACPQCQSQFLLQDELAGKQVQCQNCQAVFVAPEPNTPNQHNAGRTASPPQAQQDTFLSVFEQVSTPQGGQGFSNPDAQPAPPYGGHVKQSRGGGQGMLIGGVVVVAVVLLGLIGFGVSYAWSSFAGDPDATDLVDSNSDDPIPLEQSDFAASMIQQYGENRVAILNVNVTHEINQSAQTYLMRKAREPLGGAGSFEIRRAGGNNYQVCVAPVINFRSYAAQINWLTNKSVDQSTMTISGNARMTSGELVIDEREDVAAIAEQRRLDDERRRAEREEERERRRAEDERKKQERLAEQKKRDEERAKEAAIRTADRKHQPRPGETTVQWLTRCLDESSFIYQEFETLSKMDVEEEIREEVSGLLVKHLKNNDVTLSNELKALFRCMSKWRTDESDQVLVNMMNGDMSRHNKGEYLMPALAQIGTKKAADAMGTGLADTIYGDKTARALIGMGAVAEQAALDWREHEDSKVRFRVYHVLAEIGTRASIDPLKENRTQEKDFDMKRLIRDVLKAIEERHPEE